MKKIIWMYWQQGWDRAPDLVQYCRHSWERLNPDFELRALDYHTLFDHINLPAGLEFDRRDLTVQKVSAVARLALLYQHGGIWTDSTVMCTQPLNGWLKEYYDSGFFAFRNPGRDRLISNWFLASEPDSIILKRLYRDFSDFFVHNRFSNQDTGLGRLIVKFCSRLWNSNPRSTLRWHSWFTRKVLRVYPYFIFHYTFNKLILTDPACAKAWHSAKPFLAKSAHQVQILQSASDGVEKAIREIESAASPMHKLDWRINVSSAYWTAILQSLMEHPNDHRHSVK